MNRRSFQGKTQNRFGVFLVTIVVCMLLVVVSVDGYKMIQKQYAYQERLDELRSEIAKEHKRTNELKRLKEHIKTDEYIEELAKDKLGLVHEDEIIFKINR